MNTKKCFVVLAVAVFWVATLWGQESKDPNENVKLLQEKIERLEKTIEFQQKKYEELKADYDDIKKQLDEQIQENERLKALVKNTDIVTESVKSKFDPNNGIIYLGKQRDKLWFDRMYKQFCDKIYLNREHKCKFLTSLPKPSQYEEVWGDKSDGRGLRKIRQEIPQYIRLDSEHIGSVGQLFSIYNNVISVINKGEILIEYEIGDKTIVIHIYGLDKDYYVGQDFPGFDQDFPEGKWFINTGTFKYTAAQGRQMNVPSLTPYKSLTREQFADAIKSGIRLITQREVNGKIIETPIR